jgi:hypothetical protein
MNVSESWLHHFTTHGSFTDLLAVKQAFPFIQRSLHHFSCHIICEEGGLVHVSKICHQFCSFLSLIHHEDWILAFGLLLHWLLELLQFRKVHLLCLFQEGRSFHWRYHLHYPLLAASEYQVARKSFGLGHFRVISTTFSSSNLLGLVLVHLQFMLLRSDTSGR